MRILAWDIEASNLSADFGMILCVGFKEVGKGRPTVLSIQDYDIEDPIKAEKALLKDISKVLLDCDAWLTHFGTWYDVPFVNSRLLYHKLPTLPANHPQIDTWKVSRNRLKLRNNRLITISEFFGTKDEKNPLKGEQWIRALAGHGPSMGYIIDHCRRDVLVLEEVYLLLRPLMLDHPFTGLGRNGKCAVCGEGKRQKRGFHRTRTRIFQRYQCQACGSWSRDKGGKAVSNG